MDNDTLLKAIFEEQKEFRVQIAQFAKDLAHLAGQVSTVAGQLPTLLNSISVVAKDLKDYQISVNERFRELERKQVEMGTTQGIWHGAAGKALGLIVGAAGGALATGLVSYLIK